VQQENKIIELKNNSEKQQNEIVNLKNNITELKNITDKQQNEIIELKNKGEEKQNEMKKGEEKQNEMKNEITLLIKKIKDLEESFGGLKKENNETKKVLLEEDLVANESVLYVIILFSFFFPFSFFFSFFVKGRSENGGNKREVRGGKRDGREERKKDFKINVWWVEM
jgi:chromosome segregation ATPase